MLPSAPAEDRFLGSWIAPRKWIRNRRRNRAWAAIWLLTAAAWTYLWFLPEGGGERGDLHSTVATSIFLGVISFGFGLAGAVHAIRMARAGLWIASDGIVVRGPVKTWRLQPVDVETVTPELWAQGTPCPVLKLKNGERVGVWTLAGPGWRSRYAMTLRELEPRCADLNRVLDAVRPSAVVVSADAPPAGAESLARVEGSRLLRRIYAWAFGQATMFWAAVVIDITLLKRSNEVTFVVIAALDTALALTTALAVRAGVRRKQGDRDDRPPIGT